MKNTTIISAIALLVAGTALANAAPLSLPSSGNATAPATNTAPALSDDISNIFTWDTYKNSELGKLYVNANSAGGLGNYGQGSEGGWTYESGTGTITLCGRSGVSGEHAAFILGDEIAVGTQLGSLTLNAGAISDESYVSSYRLIIGLFDSSSNTLLGSSEVASYDTDSNSASATVNFSDGIIWNSGYKIIAGVVANGNSSGGPTSNFTISGISASYTVIPEPSAFGLLAGLGALALAGTRRRRRKA